MKKYISRFHYLTQDLPDRTHIQQAQTACEAGANWIQYRCFSKDDNALLEEVSQIAAICDDWGATLIITDHFHLLDKADIQGVHIEDMQADFEIIRKQIGEDKTLGASTNTIEDIIRIAESNSVDYIGCGPFALTLTKPNNYPLLGTDGYKAISESMIQQGIAIPLLAVGGITIDDVEELLKTGIYGIAVSAAINLAPEPAKHLKRFIGRSFEIKG